MATDVEQSQKDYLTHDLPQELLDQVIGYLDLSTQLKLRLVFSATSYESRIITTIRPTLSTLYVAASKVSLRHLRNICNSSFFQKHITTVIFVQTVASAKDCAADRLPLDNQATEAAAEFGLAYLDSDTTPTERYRRRVSECAEIDLTGNEAFRSLGMYRELLDEHKNVYADSSTSVMYVLRFGLRKLHRLQTAVISELIGRDGLNASAWLYDPDYAEARQARGLRVLQEDHAQDAACRLLDWRAEETGTAAFLDALGQSAANYLALAIGEHHMMPVGEMIEAKMTAPSPEILSSLLPWIKDLRVSSVDAAKHQREKHMRFWQPVAESALNLEELTLYASPLKRGTSCPTYEHFLNFGNYPRLKTVRLVGDYYSPSVVDAQMLRPFLMRHQRTLENVELPNVLLVHGSDYDKVCDTMRSFLSTIATDLVSLKRFELSIARIESHVDKICQIDPASKNSACNGRCEKFELTSFQSLHQAQLQELADELEVYPKDGHWPFGEFVMKKITEKCN